MATLKTPENSVGEWISVSEYASIMGISTTRVHQKIREGKLYSLSLAEMFKSYPAEYKKIGRGKSGTCSIVVFLSEDDGI